METVTLKVRVENSELQKLQADVNQLSRRQITLDPETGEMQKALHTFENEYGRAIDVITKKAKNGSYETTAVIKDNFKAIERETEKATAAYEKYAAAQRKAQENVATQMQRRVNYATGIDRDVPLTPNVTAANSMFAKLDDKTFSAYTSGAINAEQAMKGYANATATAEKAVKGYASATATAEKQNNLLGDSLDHIVLKMAAWQVIGTAAAKVIGAFREAVGTMKEVDTQLTNIQKVSNMTAEELDRVGEKAYDAASRYGVAVDEYLSSYYEMQKAGLGESAGDMAELATKTMLVGDTTAEVANKFLVSANAAWELNGSMSALSKVVDQTDFVNNNYATTLDKMADAMPIVASTAANMNMTFEETLALLATINAKTQETGRKTATAVRSFLIAISGQVGEFVDDVGETYEVTTENVEALTDALKIYGNEAVKTAMETGQVINPMEALNSLAQAYKDGLIDDIALQDMLIKVAGKMRYNQLVTIVRDLASESSTYREILEQLPDVAGTADAEIGVMLSSWESKTQILSNTWAQFISHLIDTGAVKGGLDLLIGAVKLLDSEGTKAVLTIGGITAALALLGKGIGWLTASSIPALTGAFTALTTVMLANPLFWGAAAVALIYGIVKAIDASTVSIKEQREIVATLTDDVSRLKSEYDNLYKKENRTAEEETQLALLEKELEIQERLLAVQKQQLFTKEWDGKVTTTRHGGGGNTYVTRGATYQETNSELQKYNSLQEQRAAITEQILSLTDEESEKLPELTLKLQELEEKIVSSEGELLKAYQNLSQYDEETIRSAKNGDDLVRMLEELEKTLGLTSTFEVKAKKAAEDHTDAMLEEKYQAGETGKALYDLVAAEIAADSANMTFTQQIAALKRLAQEAGIAGNALLSLRALDNYAVSKAQIDGYKRTHPGATTEQAQQALLADAWRSMTSSAGNSASYSYGASTAGNNAAERARERQRDTQQSSLNAEKKRMEAQRDAEIAAIDAQIDELKAQRKAQEDANDLAEKQLAVEKAQEALLKAQNERNVRFYNQSTGQWEWVANSVDVIKAEQALADARQELADEEAQQAYEAQLAVLEAQKEGLQAYWSNAIASIDAAVEALVDKISNIDTNITVNTTVNTNVRGGSSSSNTSTTTSTSRPTVQKPSDSANSGVSGSYQSYLDNKNKKIEQYTDTGTGGSGKYKSSGGRTFGGGGGKIVAEKYDSGGILHGFGGIKATAEDEMVLPPDVTRRLLNPDRSSMYGSVLDTLRLMTGGNGVAGKTENRIGSQHNGNVYQFGGITIGERQARTMTVADLAAYSRNLTLYKNFA